MGILKNGYGSPFITLFYLAEDGKFKVSPYSVTKLSYKYSEEGDDVATITIETSDTGVTDRPEFQKGKCLKVRWGYLEGPSKTRKVFIRDIDPEFSGTVSVTIKGTDKASYTKDFYSQKIYTADTDNEDDEFNFLKVAYDLCAKYGLKLRISGKDVEVKADPNSNPKNSGVTNKVPNFRNKVNGTNNARVVGIDCLDIPDSLTDNLNSYSSYPQANKSDWHIIWEMLKKEKSGPWVVTGKDDILIISQRDLTKKAYKSYTYRGGNGELIKVSISDKGQMTESEAESIATTSWDPKNGEFNFSGKDTFNTLTDKLNSYTQETSLVNLGLEGISTYFGVKTGSALVSWAASKLGMAKFAFRGLSSLESFGVTLAIEGMAYNARKYKDEVNTGVAQPFSNGTVINPDDDPAKNPNAVYVPGGGVDKKVVIPKVGVLIKHIRPKGPVYKNFFDPGYNEVTYSVDWQETMKMRQEEDKLKASNVDMTNQLSQVQNMLDNKGFLNRYSSDNNSDIADAEANNLKSDNDLDKIKVSGVAIGDPSIEDMQIITLNNIGKKYSGNYYVKECTHEVDINSGYLLILDDLRSNAQGIADGNATVESTKTPGSINTSKGEEVPTTPNYVTVPTESPSTIY